MKVKLMMEFSIPDELVQTKEQREEVAAGLRQWSRGCREIMDGLDEVFGAPVLHMELNAPWPKETT